MLNIMKIIEKCNLFSPFRIILLCLACLSLTSSVTAQTSIKFTLDKSYTTSAGVYRPDGTLVRTLWRREPYAAGSYTVTWDGKDDNGTTAVVGQYQIKLLYHNVQYMWEGAIGNTSQAQSGPHVYNGYLPIRDMTATDTAMFLVSGFNEGQYNLRRFAHNTPRYVHNAGRVDGWTSFSLVDTDGTNVYMANNEGGVGKPISFVSAVKVRDNSEVTFIAGQTVHLNGDNSNQTYTNVIDLDQNSDKPATAGFTVLSNAATGLAVQKSGSVLAVAHRRQNIIRLFDKVSGIPLRSIPANSPGSLSITPNGDLWAIVGTSVVRYTNLLTNPTVAATITGFANPLALATDPTNEDLVLVADGGNSQQLKAYNRDGAAQWTYGQAGGYPANGNEVRNDKFWFNQSELGETTFVTIAPDHSFWVGDIGNNRCLHFSAARSYINQIMYQSHAYVASVDANNSARVFSEFLEFQVDYSRPVGDSWTLVRNWRAGLDSKYQGFAQGLRQVTTLSNGRTYALVSLPALNYQELVELVGTRLRTTGIQPNAGLKGASPTIMPNGSLNLVPYNPPTNSTVTWQKRALTGFDGANNPQWAPPSFLASAATGTNDPYPRPGGFGDVLTPVTSSGMLVSFDYSKNNNWHLGAVKLGGNSWLWKAAPTGALDGKGSYDIGNGVQYAGNVVMATGRNIVYGYHGEFWGGQQASQWMHFYDDGLVVGQFGETTVGHTASDGVLGGSAGNGVSPTMVVQNGETYMWVNDEGGHGPMRWHLVGLNTIQEATGTGALNSTIALTNPTATFPTQVTATPGNGQVQLSWTTVPGAASYNVKYGSTPGGPYTVAATGLTTNRYTLGNLVNDVNYYVVVEAKQASGASATSEEEVAIPHDPNVNVQLVGNTASNYIELPVNSAAPAAGQPALRVTQPMHYSPDKLLLDGVGSKGYVLYNWGGAGTDKVNVRAPFTVSKGNGWRNDNYAKYLFKVDDVAGSDYSLYSNTAGSINVTVSDNNWHYLTAFCPVRFADARSCKVTLTPQGQPAPAATYYINENPGKNHVIQFRFKGNVTLTVDNQNGTGGTLQALFLDDEAVATVAPSTIMPMLAGANQLTNFTLVNADNAQDIRTLVAGETLNLATLPTRNLNIRANPASAMSGSVIFSLTGAQTKTVADDSAPYTLFDKTWTPATGAYTLKGTAYTASGGNGAAGTTITTTFSVIDQAPSSTSAVYRLNVGGAQLTTSAGVFEADNYFVPSPGITASTNATINNAVDNQLYQTERRSNDKTFSYYLTVPNGQYRVVLHFAETQWSAVGQRVFDVTFEGNKVLDNYDIFKKVGANTATTETIPVTVSDGVLSINFSALPSDGGADQPTLAALEVLNAGSAGIVVKSQSFDAAVAAAAAATQQQVTAYPNPTADGRVAIALPTALEGDLHYTLVSVLGSPLAKGTVHLPGLTSVVQLDLSPYMQTIGAYYLMLQQNTWRTSIKLQRKDN